MVALIKRVWLALGMVVPLVLCVQTACGATSHLIVGTQQVTWTYNGAASTPDTPVLVDDLAIGDTIEVRVPAGRIPHGFIAVTSDGTESDDLVSTCADAAGTKPKAVLKEVNCQGTNTNYAKQYTGSMFLQVLGTFSADVAFQCFIHLDAMAGVLRLKTTPAGVTPQNALKTFANLTIDDIRERAGPRIHNPEQGFVRLGELVPELTAVAANTTLKVDPRRSLFVTDLKSMSHITFDEVISQLVAQSGDPHLTKLNLYRQWWDGNGVQPGLARGPHCDDETLSSNPNDPKALARMNGFKYRCPRLESQLANTDPFANPGSDAGYTAIAFVNRFDLIDDARHPTDCGEYRVVFARNSGLNSATDRNLIIFEARVPNPHRERLGVKGCREILDFWHGLSADIGADERGKRLHDFFMKGDLQNGKRMPLPVIHVNNYTFGTGQIRVNQFHNPASGGAGNPFDWTLREYKTLRTNGSLQIVVDSAKTNPAAELFEPASTDRRLGTLEQILTTQLETLASTTDPADPNSQLSSIGAKFSIQGLSVNSFESDEASQDPANNGDIAGAGRFDKNSPLGKAIQAALDKQPTNAPTKRLTADNIVHRLRTQTCSGCHHFSAGDSALGGNVTWPGTLGDPAGGLVGFTQVSEREKEPSADPQGGERWKVSPVVQALLTHRLAFMGRALGLKP